MFTFIELMIVVAIIGVLGVGTIVVPVAIAALLQAAWGWVRPTGTPTAAPTASAPAPKAKDQRPLWAQAPMVDAVPPRCSAWENEQARTDSRLVREAQAAKAAREEAEADRRMRARLEREAEERRAFDREWQAANDRHKPEKKPWYALTHLEVRYPKD